MPKKKVVKKVIEEVEPIKTPEMVEPLEEETTPEVEPQAVEEMEMVVNSYVGRTVSVNGHQVKVMSEIMTENGVLVKDEAGVTYLI